VPHYARDLRIREVVITITIAIPRHREINEILVKKILKEAGL
jgi:hypothetical protein